MATLRQGRVVKPVDELLEHGAQFFQEVEVACDDLHLRQRSSDGNASTRNWSELRIRKPELVPDGVTLPLQRLREGISQLIKLSDDRDMGQELAECNRRL